MYKFCKIDNEKIYFYTQICIFHIYHSEIYFQLILKSINCIWCNNDSWIKLLNGISCKIDNGNWIIYCLLNIFNILRNDKIILIFLYNIIYIHHSERSFFYHQLHIFGIFHNENINHWFLNCSFCINHNIYKFLEFLRDIKNTFRSEKNYQFFL